MYARKEPPHPRRRLPFVCGRLAPPPLKFISLTVLIGIVGCGWLWISRHFDRESRVEELGTISIQIPTASKKSTLETISSPQPFNRYVPTNLNAEVQSKTSPKQSGSNSFSGPLELKEWAVNASMRSANYINSILKFNTNTSGISSISEENNFFYKLKIFQGRLAGTISSTDHVVQFWEGEFMSYSDKRFRQQRIATDRDFFRTLGQEPNYLSEESAVKLVYKTLRELGINDKQLRDLGKPRIFFPPFEKVPPIYEICFPGYKINPQMFQAKAEVLGSIPGGRITQLTIIDVKVLPNGWLKLPQ